MPITGDIGDNLLGSKNATLDAPYRCRDCRDYFSVRSGTALANSKVSMRDWAEAIDLFLSSLKSVSSMMLHRDLGVTQKTAWFMLHRLRQAFDDAKVDLFEGPVEVDETYLGGKLIEDTGLPSGAKPIRAECWQQNR